MVFKAGFTVQALLGYDQVVFIERWIQVVFMACFTVQALLGHDQVVFIERWSLDTSGLAGFTVQALLGHDKVVFIERWSLDTHTQNYYIHTQCVVMAAWNCTQG